MLLRPHWQTDNDGKLADRAVVHSIFPLFERHRIIKAIALHVSFVIHFFSLRNSIGHSIFLNAVDCDFSSDGHSNSINASRSPCVTRATAQHACGSTAAVSRAAGHRPRRLAASRCGNAFRRLRRIDRWISSETSRAASGAHVEAEKSAMVACANRLDRTLQKAPQNL